MWVFAIGLSQISFSFDQFEKKRRDLNQPMTKNKLYTHSNIQKATQKYRFTTIADRLRTVSWSNDSKTTGVDILVYGISTFILTAKAV